MGEIDRRTFLRGGAATVGAIYLASCGGGETKPGATSLTLPGDDAGFPSPFAYMRGPGYIQMAYIYDSLLWKDESGKLLPWLASGYKASADGTMYMFTLREGIKWHDGRPLTAADVAFSYEYFAKHKDQISPQVIVQPVPDIQEVRATGARTVEFRLRNPVATFLGYGGAGAVPIVPKHIWSSIDDPVKETDPKVLVGSGPYRLKSYKPGEGAYLYTANDKYFLGRPVVRRIENRPASDELSALMAGQLDEAGGAGLRPAALEQFRRSSGLEVIQEPVGVSGTGLYWNLAQGGALADRRFRRACALAIDRKDMVQRLLGGNGVPGNPGWIPPTNPFHVDVEQYSFDPGAANRMLDAAGYKRSGSVRKDPRGRPLSFTLAVPNEPPSPIPQLLVAALGKIGVELKPQPLDTPTLAERLIKGATEMSLIGFGGMNSDLAADYLRLIYSSKTKITQHAQGYENPAVDRLCQEQLTTLDTGRRKQIVGRIQQLVAGDLPLLPLIYPTSFAIVSKKAFGSWYYTPGGVAGVVPTVENKHAFIFGRKNGLKS